MKDDARVFFVKFARCRHRGQACWAWGWLSRYNDRAVDIDTNENVVS